LQASEWTVVTEVDRGGTMTMYCGSDICDDGDGGVAGPLCPPAVWVCWAWAAAANGWAWRKVCCIECKMEKMRLSFRSGWAEAEEMDERWDDDVDDLCDSDLGDEELDDDMDEMAVEELLTEANEIKLDVLETGRCS
jgi:hypothetical protein